jgi:hypothetical protein
VVIGMRVHERSAQGRGLDGQRERDGNHFPHGGSIVRDRSPGVKQSHHMRD